jgi:hypothetical protein
MDKLMKRVSSLALPVVLTGVFLGGPGCTAVSHQTTFAAAAEWQPLAAIGGPAQSRLAPSHWPYDKYPKLPEVTPKSKTV